MMTRLSGRTHSVASGVTVAVLRPVLDAAADTRAIGAPATCTWVLEGVEVVETRERRTVPAVALSASAAAAAAAPAAAAAAAAAADTRAPLPASAPAPAAATVTVDITRYRFVNETEVEFGALPPAVIASYVATSDPYDKAGGYGVQALAAQFVRAIRGDYYTVVGLPVFLVAALLRHVVAAHPLFAAASGEATALDASPAPPSSGGAAAGAAGSGAAGSAATRGAGVPGARE